MLRRISFLRKNETQAHAHTDTYSITYSLANGGLKDPAHLGPKQDRHSYNVWQYFISCIIRLQNVLVTSLTPTALNPCHAIRQPNTNALSQNAKHSFGVATAKHVASIGGGPNVALHTIWEQ